MMHSLMQATLGDNVPATLLVLEISVLENFLVWVSR